MVVQRSAIFRIFGICLSFLLILVPVCRESQVKAIALSDISDTVVGIFLAVSLALGFTFNVVQDNISAWARAKIQAYCQAQGFSSIEAWLGADIGAELTVKGSFLGLTPSLWDKLKACVEFSIGIGDSDLPAGGSVDTPVNKTISGGFYFPTLSVNGTDITNFTILDLRPYLTTSSNYPGKSTLLIQPIPGISTSSIPITVPDPLVNFTTAYTFTSNSLSITPNYVGTLESPNYTTSSGNTVAFSDYSWYSSETFTYIPVNNGIVGHMNMDRRYNTYIIFGALDQNHAVPILVYTAIDGNTYIIFPKNPYNYGLRPFGGDQMINASGSGQPNYNFNNSDLIYIDLQLGQLNSALQAIIDLISGINNNLISWTVAIQTNSPEDLPVNMGSLTDFVNYCNEQTNLYMSGTATMAETLGNMYNQLYTTLGTITAPTLSNAVLTAYNAFINKLTFFEISTSSLGADFASVQSFQVELQSYYQNATSTGNITSNLNNAVNRLQYYVANATSIEEIIGLNNAYQSFLDQMGFRFSLAAVSKNAVSLFNDIVDSYTAGSITAGDAVDQLYSTYKTQIRAQAKTAEDVSAIVTAYQLAVDKITLNAFNVDPEGLGTTAPEAFEMEEDLLNQLDMNSLSSFLQFQNWQFVNLNEANLYREYFQKILSSESPFYLFLYVPLVLGLVGIILGTRIHFGGKNVSTEEKVVHVRSRSDGWDY